MELRGKVAVITGAAGGIGQALAIEAANRGMRIVAVDVNAADETVEAVLTVGGHADAVVCDIADQDAVNELAIWCDGHLGAVHVLAANAGIGAMGSLESCSAEDFARVMAVNLFGTFYTVRAFAPLLRRAAAAGSSAAMLITGSEHSLGIPHNQHAAAYTISKHALLGMADVARGDLDDTGVSVTLLCPGWTLTRDVADYVRSDPEAGRAITPIAQTPGVVATCAWDAVEQRTFLAPTNPASAGHAMARVQEITAAFARLSERRL